MSEPIPPHPILYSFRRCPYAMRARLAIRLSGLTVELREVVLRDKPAELLNTSAKGTVPVLQLPTGEVIDQSLDIMRWAFEHRDPLGCLQDNLAAQLALIKLHDTQFKPLLDRYKYPERHPELSFAEHQYQAMYWLKSHIEANLDKHTHLFSNKVSLADLAIMPFIRQCAAVDAAAFAQHASPQLQQWLSHWLASELLHACMEKYPQWRAGQAPVLFGAK
ncbi:glutathione S-transferase N-terminal domain-containing protein [Chitinibacter sp. SCUT-21]|uniref:glutathione S-transferase N-terminal domain-containing protein n=1 Tax=Chitinibacter sp. SCUT-21 TaxID=2970891 RepID=UPI0035A655D5